jgi:hypothetical protein
MKGTPCRLSEIRERVEARRGSTWKAGARRCGRTGAGSARSGDAGRCTKPATAAGRKAGRHVCNAMKGTLRRLSGRRVRAEVPARFDLEGKSAAMRNDRVQAAREAVTLGDARLPQRVAGMAGMRATL